MKKRFWSVLLALAMVLTMLPATAMADASSADLTNAENWISDRTEPEGFAIADGVISFSVKEQPGAESWYGWQGRKAYTYQSASNYWKVRYTMDVTDTMLNQHNTNVSLWIQVDKAGTSGAESQQDTIDWAIVQFINTTDGAKWQSWDSKGSGAWKDISSVPAAVGSYSIVTEFFNGTISQYINGQLANSYAVGATETTPASLIAQGRSYGAAFDVRIGVPSVTAAFTNITVDSAAELTTALEAAQNGATITLASDIAVDKMLDIAANGVTLDLGGHTLTASASFDGPFDNAKHLVNVTGTNVTIKNGTLKTTTANKHVLNVYEATGTVVENLIVDHTNAFSGAPVVVNGSDLTVKGQLTMITGDKSWYAMNVDNKTDSTGADTCVTFAENAAVDFSGVSSFGISLETSKENAVSKVVFQPNVSLTAPDQFAVVFNGETQKSVTEVVNPQNAGLVEVAENVYVKGATVSVVVDGAVYQSAAVVPGTQFTLPAAPSKDSYLFSGWSDGTNTYNAGDVVTINQNTTFTALWTYLPPVIVPPTTGGTTGGNSSTVTNPDGSTTTTVTKPDGTVTVTDKDTQGNVTETVTNPNGTSTTTVTNTNGSSSVTTVDQTGKVQAQVKLPQNVIANAAGEAVTLPVAAVPVTSNQAAAPVVSIDLPAGVSAKVEVPVVNATAGTVAVLVNADGSQEIVKTSVTTADGVVLTVEDGATVMIVDNSKDFADVSATYWGSDAIDFATSRDLFNGTSATTFSPEADMNRAMIVTVLARLEGVDTTGGSTWYEAGRQWAISAGISDGSDMNGSVTREQLAAMLYRYAGSPAVNGAAVAGFADADNVSDWAADAMAWAVSQGIISGMGGQLNPQGDATRAQVATILMRFIATL